MISQLRVALIGAAISIISLTGAAGAVDNVRTVATAPLNHAQMQQALKKALDGRGAVYTNAALSAAASDCVAKLRPRSISAPVNCGAGGHQFRVWRK